MDWDRADNLTYRVSLPKGDGQERLRELIVYVSDRCHDDPKFGLTKLNKILHRADFRSFVEYGEPITGLPYMKEQHGPVPRAMTTTLRTMEGCDLTIRTVSYHGKEQRRPTPLRQPNLELFSARELELVDAAIDWFWNKSATEASLESHGIAWTMTAFNQDIPYEGAYLSDEPVTEDDVDRTGELARELGWRAD